MPLSNVCKIEGVFTDNSISQQTQSFRHRSNWRSARSLHFPKQCALCLPRSSRISGETGDMVVWSLGYKCPGVYVYPVPGWSGRFCSFRRLCQYVCRLRTCKSTTWSYHPVRSKNLLGFPLLQTRRALWTTHNSRTVLSEDMVGGFVHRFHGGS